MSYTSHISVLSGFNALSGAEEIAQEMVSHPLDMSYMGVYTIWMNDLGKYLTILVEGNKLTAY